MEAKTAWRAALAGVLAAALTLAGCSRAALLGGGGTSASLPQITLGLIGAAPGPGSFEGSFTGQAAQLAVDAINAAGGLAWQGQHYDLRLAYAGWPDLRGAATNLLFGDPAPLALLGPDESDAVRTVAPVVASADLAMLTVAAAADLTAGNPDVIRLRPSDAWIAATLTVYVVQRLGLRAVAVAPLDNAYGQTGDATITAALAGQGLRPVADVALPPGLTDAGDEAARLIAAHPSAIISWATAPEAANLLLALRAAGWAGQFAVGALDADFQALAGPAGVGAVGPATWLGAATNAASAAFVTSYQQRYGTSPDDRSAAMYDAVRLVAAAITAGGPSRAAIRAYLAHLSAFPGVQGTLDAARGLAVLGSAGEVDLNLVIVRVTAAGLSVLP